jgi:RNA polymerase sigma-70 factor (ECF subfamily)
VLPAAANGCPTFGQYRADPGGGHQPWALHVLEVSGGRVARVHSFLDADRLFPQFGLPAYLPGLTDRFRQRVGAAAGDALNWPGDRPGPGEPR